MEQKLNEDLEVNEENEIDENENDQKSEKRYTKRYIGYDDKPMQKDGKDRNGSTKSERKS